MTTRTDFAETFLKQRKANRTALIRARMLRISLQWRDTGTKIVPVLQIAPKTGYRETPTLGQIIRKGVLYAAC